MFAESLLKYVIYNPPRSNHAILYPLTVFLKLGRVELTLVQRSTKDLPGTHGVGS